MTIQLFSLIGTEQRMKDFHFENGKKMNHYLGIKHTINVNTIGFIILKKQV